jgi:hypothetical protein
MQNLHCCNAIYVGDFPKFYTKYIVCTAQNRPINHEPPVAQKGTHMYYDSRFQLPDQAAILRKAHAARSAHLGGLIAAASRAIVRLFSYDARRKAADQEIRAMGDGAIADAGLSVAQVTRARRHDEAAKRNANSNTPLGVPGPRAAA